MKRGWAVWRAPAGIGLAVVLALIPYAVALRLAPGGSVFSGFLLNPIDGFTYLAKMRQGWDGAWLFRLSYTDVPGDPSLLYPYHLLLGHLARALRLPLIVMYHAARAANTLLMFLAGREFLRRSPLADRGRGAAFGLILFGSGWGWLAAGAGLIAADLEMPEVIPWVSGYANSHFPLAAACLLVLAAVFLSPPRSRRAVFLLSLGSGFVLGAVAGYATLPLGAAMTLWLALSGRTAGQEALRLRIYALAGLVAGAGPWLAYTFWLSQVHPILSLWFEQNVTPSPSPLSYLLAYAPLLILIAFGSWRRTPPASPAPSFLAVWAILTALSLYSPFALQRRLALGLFFPLAALAGWAIETSPRRGLATTAAIVSGLPSLALVVLAGLASVRSGTAGTVIPVESQEAMQWLGAHARQGSVVLAGPETGNMIPAFAGVHVIYGHPFETPRAEDERRLVVGLLTGEIEAGRAMAIARDRNVAYLFYGPEERSLGEPAWLAALEVAFSNSQVTVYGFPAP